MTQQEIYEEFKALAEQLGLSVRLELGDFDGGLCVLNDKKVILVNRRHDMGKRLSVIARALYRVGFGEVFVKPAIREIIEEEAATM
jgi:hypothetical protein